ncbi:RsbRD N-terminal domain-containing protein [Desulfosporosinus sp. PR]|uniref:RsbRD N-terminal domain-containing protein n=1 Tax=Candidatus Desulfosporosinus nitrosoreducens TaxID=3401928 RepID=UPI0027FB4D5F|nr:RsbRD N-terminal domain-containing protein [Desulfosporosinus sp. PR]MDQ7094532.1 RsbRD N-terminal domain-containing protein [Desulfosporosinus sp. PR]
MDSMLKDFLEQKKSVLVSKWFDEILNTYPNDPAGMLRKQKDRFQNPVGHTITVGTDELFTALLEGKDFTEGMPFLDDIIRVRAVQDFSPSKAVSFIFMLKKVIREELGKEIRQNQIYEELLKFESQIDDLALFAFDIYSGCREQLNTIKTEELKRMTFTLLKKANLMYEIPDQEGEPQNPAQEVERKELKFNI